MQDIIDIIAAAKALSEPGALVTVVRIEGSTYRRPGARMLVAADGTITGSVSGGCVEGDAAIHASEVISSGNAAHVTYDTTSETDIIIGMGLGCEGIIDVLIEPYPPASADMDALSIIADVIRDRRPAAIATVYSGEDGRGPQAGARLVIRPDGSVADSIHDDALRDILLQEANAILAGDAEFDAKTISLSDGASYGVLVERVSPPPSVLIFGAGPDAVPLVALAHQLGWNVSVVDRRPAYAVLDRFPDAQHVVCCDAEAVMDHVDIDQHDAVIIMTHHYPTDVTLLKAILPVYQRYLAVLGPKKRMARLLADMESQGVPVPEGQEARLYNPAGLDIGAESPEEIALSVIAEIMAVTTGRCGGLLRDRAGPIH